MTRFSALVYPGSSTTVIRSRSMAGARPGLAAVATKSASDRSKPTSR